MQTIANHVVILGVPDYGTTPEYGYIYGTDVTSGELGTGYGETRNIRRTGKRRTQAWTIKTSTGYETFSIEESIRAALESKKAAVPWLPHVRQVLSVDGNTLTLNSEPYGMASGTRLWYVDMDTRRGGYLISGGATGATLTVTDGTGVTARCIIAPLMFGILDSANVSIRTVSGNTYELNFRESANGGAAPAIVVPPEDIGFFDAGGDEEYFRVLATGREPMSYTWTLDGAALTSTTAEQPVVTGLDTMGVYSVTVSNDFGSATASATLGQIELWDGVQDDELETVTAERDNGLACDLSYSVTSVTDGYITDPQTEGMACDLTFDVYAIGPTIIADPQTEAMTCDLTFSVEVTSE